MKRTHVADAYRASPHGRRLVRKEKVQGLSLCTAPKKQPHNRAAFSLGILNCYALFMAENFADMLIVGRQVELPRQG
jgi:hypothetical protein